jgi:hypothetical protein
MGKMNRLFAMTDSVKDADASSPTKKKTGKIGGIGVLAACLAGSLMVAPAAQAKLLHATLTVALEGLIDTFTIESNGGVQLPGDPDAIFFPISNNTTGFTAVTFSDLNVGAFGAFGIGTSPANFSPQFADAFLPPVYDGTPAASFNLAPGTYNGFLQGSVLTLAVPEPTTWTLMIAGAAAIGSLQVGRRRRQLAAA